MSFRSEASTFRLEDVPSPSPSNYSSGFGDDDDSNLEKKACNELDCIKLRVDYREMKEKLEGLEEQRFFWVEERKNLQAEVNKLQKEVESSKVHEETEKDEQTVDVKRKNTDDDSTSNKRRSIYEVEISIANQSSEYYQLLSQCGDPSSQRFIRPNGINRHFAEHLGPQDGRCVPCQYSVPWKVVRGRSYFDKNKWKNHKACASHNTAEENFLKLQQALKCELIEKPQYKDELLTAASVNWRITRSGEVSHFKTCSDQQCDFCPISLDLQYLEFVNETRNVRYRLTMKDTIECSSLFILYFSTCLLHRHLKYVGATTVTMRDRKNSYNSKFEQAKRTDEWTTHFALLSGGMENPCKYFHRMYPIVSTYDPNLTYGQNVALLHANENFLIDKSGSADDRFGMNTLNSTMPISPSIVLGEKNSGRKYLKPNESKNLNFTCPFCSAGSEFKTEASLCRHLQFDHENKLIVKDLLIPIPD